MFGNFLYCGFNSVTHRGLSNCDVLNVTYFRIRLNLSEHHKDLDNPLAMYTYVLVCRRFNHYKIFDVGMTVFVRLIFLILQDLIFVV